MQIEKMDADLRLIHNASMQMLEKNGIRVKHPEVLAKIEECGVRVKGEMAYITQDQIEQWVSKAPSRFKLFARNSAYDIEIGGKQTESAPGFGAPNIIDAHGGTRPALMADFVSFLKLFHQSDFFNINGGVLVQPNDVPLQSSSALMLYASLLYTDKCLMAATGSKSEIEPLMEMLALVFGGKAALINKPRVITIISLNSPLQIDRSQLDSLQVYLDYGQPVIFTPGAMTGTTAPVTLAGATALANAETLAGIAIAQMIRPGTPVVYGGAASVTDMRTAGFSSGAPENALFAEYSARLARAYDLPSRTSGSISDAQGICVQTGYESMMNCLTRHQAGQHLSVHAAGLLDAVNAMSYEKFIVDLEVLGMVKYLMAGMTINEETLAVDVVNQVGSGGEFLTHKHTLKHCRTEPFVPGISLRGSAGNPHELQLELIRQKKNALLASYCRPALPPLLDIQLYEYMLDCGFDAEITAQLHKEKYA